VIRPHHRLRRSRSKQQALLREARVLIAVGSRAVNGYRLKVIDCGGTVRISVEVPDELHRRAKAAAATAGVSLREYVIAALELATKASERARTKR
jgi:Antitoxin ParD